MMFQPCFLAVEMKERMIAKSADSVQRVRLNSAGGFGIAADQAGRMVVTYTAALGSGSDPNSLTTPHT
jgi:hypothetical protein